MINSVDLNAFRIIEKNLRAGGGSSGGGGRQTNVIHSGAGHTMNGRPKTPYQTNVLTKQLRPRIRRDGTYDRERTIVEMHQKVSNVVLSNNTNREKVWELLRLIEYENHTVKSRVHRNTQLGAHTDPNPRGHQIARTFATDRLKVLRYYFPETKKLFH